MGEGRTDESRRTNRLTVQQAAAHLGISEGAVRNRIKRDTLGAEREGGRVYVLLSGPANRDEPDDESRLVSVLREQLAEEREARRRADTIIAQLARTTEEQARTIRELEAPADEAAPEARESPSEAEEASDRAPDRPATGEPQEGVQAPRSRSWWRRIIGG